MAVLLPEILHFLDELEAFAHRDLPHRHEVGVLLQRAKEPQNTPLFEDLIFIAKFVSKTSEVMRRIGPSAEGYQKLATEFKDNAQRASALVKTLLKEGDRDLRQQFTESYFGLDQKSFARLLDLLADLSWVKNWRVDGKPLP
jgi:hypothetical protein